MGGPGLRRVGVSSWFLDREELGNVGAARAREWAGQEGPGTFPTVSEPVTLVLLPAGSRNLSPSPDPSVKGLLHTRPLGMRKSGWWVCVCVLKTAGCSGDVAHAKGRIRSERKQEPYTFSKGP